MDINLKTNSKSTLYEKVANQMEKLILTDSIRVGEKLPSVRQAKRKLKVSLATVLQAYEILENRGLIEARPQSGYYVKPHFEPPLVQPRAKSFQKNPRKVEVNDFVLSYLRSIRNPNFVHLGVANPDPNSMPSRALRRLSSEIIRKDFHWLEYELPPGHLPLRREISKRMLDAGVSIDPSEVEITNGCMEALTLSLRVTCQPGDTVAVESPTFYGVLQAIQALGLKALEIPTDPKTGVDVDLLIDAFRTKRVSAALLISNFSNPSGGTIPDPDKERIAQAAAKYKVPVIEDDIYGDLALCGTRPRTIKSFDEEGLVLYCSSFSKTLSPGLRIGWSAPGRYWSEMNKIKFMTTIATPTLTQMQVAAYLKSGGYDRHLRLFTRELLKNRNSYLNKIERAFPKGTQVNHPRGGFSLWLELPSSVDSMKLFERSLKEKVSISPGRLFSACSRYSNYIRINFSHRWSERTCRAIAKVGRLAKEMA